MSREAVKYKITLEREDGKPLCDNTHKIESSFRSDNYLTAEYRANLRKTLFKVLDHEWEMYERL